MTCGGCTFRVKKSECIGANFDIGKAVTYKGVQCTIKSPCNEGGDLKVQYPAAELECNATELDLSGLKLTSVDWTICSAFISSKCQ